MSAVPGTSRLWVPGVARLPHRPPRDAQGHDADRHVDPEHGRPREVLGQKPAGERADRETEARDAGPDPDRLRELLARERGHQDRQRERVQERAADALHGPEADQLGVGLRQGARRRREREHEQADLEDALAPEPVAQLAAEQDQGGEHQDVGVHRPLQVLRGGLQLLLDRRQRHVHDRVVEHDHEQGEAHRKQRPPLVVWVIVSHSVSSGTGGARNRRPSVSATATNSRGAPSPCTAWACPQARV